jgi:hypothetical protein
VAAGGASWNESAAAAPPAPVAAASPAPAAAAAPSAFDDFADGFGGSAPAPAAAATARADGFSGFDAAGFGGDDGGAAWGAPAAPAAAAVAVADPFGFGDAPAASAAAPVAHPGPATAFAVTVPFLDDDLAAGSGQGGGQADDWAAQDLDAGGDASWQ